MLAHTDIFILLKWFLRIVCSNLFCLYLSTFQNDRVIFTHANRYRTGWSNRKR